MAEPVTRRRALALFAAAGTLAAAGLPGAAHARYRWSGTALGADASITIEGTDQMASRSLITGACDEIDRLEQIFSLYRRSSEISRLNATGRLDGASHELRLLLDRSLSYWQATGGAFNPAIQPLWQLLARHFSADPASPGPASDRIAATLRLCDPGRIIRRGARIELAPGMALTFNGIAQGFITDAVAGLLADAGLADILIDLGELRALPGRPWRIGIAGSDSRVDLNDRAVATSSGAGTPLSADGRWHHLIDPLSGTSPHHLGAVTVTAPTATEADALSTALFVLPSDMHASLLRRFPDARIATATLP
jgi:thiamine biosynthesis lipoprotein